MTEVTKLQTTGILKVTKQDVADLDYALYIVRINQNTHGEPDEDKQSVRAYKLLSALYHDLGLQY